MQTESIQIIGLHFIDAPEPCCLIEVTIEVASEQFDWGNVTQEVPDQPPANWQVAYDEQPLNEARSRWAFFFHYPNFEKPLLTPLGPVDLPQPSALPVHLEHIEYEEP